MGRTEGMRAYTFALILFHPSDSERKGRKTPHSLSGHASACYILLKKQKNKRQILTCQISGFSYDSMQLG